MGSISAKLSWLIARKKWIVDWINSKTNYNNTTGASKPFTGTYASIPFYGITNNLVCFFPNGYPEVIAYVHYENGVLNTGYNVGHYIRPGVSVSCSRADTGKYNFSITHPSDLAGYEYQIFAYGGHRGSDFNDSCYATCSPTNYTSFETHTFLIFTSDDSSRNDGSFTILVLACKSI